MCGSMNIIKAEDKIENTLRIESDLWKFVQKSKQAFNNNGVRNGNWSQDVRNKTKPLRELGVKVWRTTVEESPDKFTIAEVTQPMGVLIPPHRHKESHVLLKVTKGAIQVDCEGYSRRVEKGNECLIPKGFTHSVFALKAEKAKDESCAVYLSAHYEEWLSIDDNSYLQDWSKYIDKTEVDVVIEKITWFLALQPEYLLKHNSYRAWFYVLHINPDDNEPDVDKVGLVGCWYSHLDQAYNVMNKSGDVPNFRLGKLLSDKKWSNSKLYPSIFCAHKNISKASEISDFLAYKDSSKWILDYHNGNDVINPFLLDKSNEYLEGYQPFQKYMRLLTESFLNNTEYLVYLTPPQQPGLDAYIENCQRQPFSSLIMGVSHSTETFKAFIDSLFTFFLIQSSILQQMRFAVRSDTTKIRYDEQRRKQLLKDFLDSPKNPTYLEALKSLAIPRLPVPDTPFEGLKHTLKVLQEHFAKTSITNTKETDKGYINKLIKNLMYECTPQARLLVDVISMLGNISDLINNDRFDRAKTELENIANELNGLSEAPRHYVEELCKTHQAHVGKSFFLNNWNVIDHYLGRSDKLLFDLGELRVAVAALRANIVKNNENNFYHLGYYENKGKNIITSVITWLEHTDIDNLINQEGNSNANYNIFLKCIRKSAEEKGLHRGLPQVLLFGIENKAVLLQIYLQDEWHNLLPVSDEKKYSDPIKLSYELILEDIPNKTHNYGWRFVFEQAIKTNESNKSSDKKSASQTIETKNYSLFLVDDKREAEWCKKIRDLLEHYNFNKGKIITIEESDDYKYENFNKKIEFDVKSSISKKYILVTDSKFFNNANGGENLLTEVAKHSGGKCIRGLVYSTDPSLQQNDFKKYTNIQVDKLVNTRNYAEDARQIACFLRTGNFDPLEPLIDMMRRFVRVLDTLLNLGYSAPWYLSQNLENTEDHYNPWHGLTETLGLGVLTPFSPETWKLFTNTPLDESIRNRLGSNDDEIKEFIDTLRKKLCPVDSLVSMVDNESYLYSPLRSLWIIVAQWNDFKILEDQKFAEWATNQANKLGHKEIGLKYIHYLINYRTKIFNKSMDSLSWDELTKLAIKDVDSIKDLLNKWDKTTLPKT